MLVTTVVVLVNTMVSAAVATVIIADVGAIDFSVGVVRGNIVLTFGGASDGKSAFLSTLLLGVICNIANPKMYSGTVSIIRVIKNVWRFCLRLTCEGDSMLLQKINRHCYVWHTK